GTIAFNNTHPCFCASTALDFVFLYHKNTSIPLYHNYFITQDKLHKKTQKPAFLKGFIQFSLPFMQ
ncbi:MAG: hypothetical protein KGZ57_06940, partial [Dethiobacter sp.]|nr:hypothetical protein [Dethiobacter sp.]